MSASDCASSGILTGSRRLELVAFACLMVASSATADCDPVAASEVAWISLEPAVLDGLVVFTVPVASPWASLL